MPLTSSQRSTLRGIAMQRAVDLHVGRPGITPNVLKEIDQLLNRQELVKLKFGEKQAPARASLLDSICSSLGAELAGTVGRTAAIYRYSETAEMHLLGEAPGEDEPIG